MRSSVAPLLNTIKRCRNSSRYFFSSNSNSSSPVTWNQTAKSQTTLANKIVKKGKGLHSGASTIATLSPAMAGEGRFFVTADRCFRIPASIDFVTESALCTTVSNDGARVRTVEHLLSALEAMGVDNCCVEIAGGDEVPLLDGSAREWVEAIEEAGLRVATDCNGGIREKLAPFVNKPVYVKRGDSFIAAFPSSKVQITYGISFQEVPAIGSQWFSCSPLDDSIYVKEIAASRTFCIYEEVQQLRSAGLIKGGSIENALVCSAATGWLNPPLHFDNEPCRHKVLDLVGDLSLFAQNGHQGLPVAHIITFKGGHSLHAEFVRHLSKH